MKMNKKQYVRTMRLIALGLTVSGAVAIGRTMPVYREVVTTKVEQRTVVQTIKVKKPEKVIRYTDVCRGEPSTIIKIALDQKRRVTYFLLQPVGTEWVVPCKLGGYWPEFETGMIISIPQGEPG